MNNENGNEFEREKENENENLNENLDENENETENENGKDKDNAAESTALSFENQKIDVVGIHDEVKRSFIAYSMSVITSRALPDVRDGLKPGQRRILYAMYEDNITYDRPFRKSAATVGYVIANYHPHGDAAVYMTMARMAQPFSLRYTLVEGQGNFGSVDGDPPAAYRYTEARLSRISGEMLADLDKNVVDFRPNFDNRKKEPVVLPSRFPNLLVNGSMGIAVGMATNIPPHNLGEVIDGTIYLMENPDATSADLVQYIKGPDFPTGAIIYGSAGIYDAYQTGRGRICVRSRAEIEEKHHRIIFTEIPYGVNKSMLIESIANLVKDKRIDGITGLRDESGRHGMRIVVEYRRDTNPQVLLNQLYKYTQLQDTCAVNMLALVDGVPKVLGLKEILTHYIKFQEDVVRRRVEFDLDRARREAHIYEGYKIAIDNIDEVVSIIRSSSSIPDARTALSERFGLTEVQAQAIVEMTLGRLTGLERQKVEERLLRLYETIKEYEAILADEERIKGIIKEELLEIKRKYADPRMTEIVPVEDEIILEDLIERHRCVITVTHEGYIKRQRADVYTTQRRGGVGVVAMSTKEEDFIEKVMAVGSHSYLLMFTNTGRVYIRKAYQIPESGRASRGSNIVNILELQEGEAVTAFIAAEDFAPEKYLIMVTKRGIVKRTALSEFKYQRRGGKIAITFNEGDELVFVRCTDGTCDIIIATDSGRAVRFSEKAVPVHGRTARGVRGIKITDGGRVVGVAVIEKNDERSLLTVTENGYGKRTDFSLFDRKNRGGMGVLCHGINEKTGPLAGIASVGDGDDVMLITTEGVMIRTPVSEINKYGRTASGVIVMRIRDENTKIASITCIPEKEENETSAGEGDGEKSERQGKSDYTKAVDVSDDIDEIDNIDDIDDDDADDVDSEENVDDDIDEDDV